MHITLSLNKLLFFLFLFFVHIVFLSFQFCSHASNSSLLVPFYWIIYSFFFVVVGISENFAFHSNDTVDDNGTDVQLPSFIRAILQPNYLEEVEIKLMPGNETFHSDSATHFHSFMDTLKVRHILCFVCVFPLSSNYYVFCLSNLQQNRPQFSMFDVMFEWLKWVSKCYHVQLPIELQTLYINIFEHHWWVRLPFYLH